MTALWIILVVIFGLAIIFFGVLLFCYFMTFYVPRRTKKYLEKYKMPPGKVYLEYEDVLIPAMKKVRSMPCEKVEIKSFDNLTLRGRYFETKKGAPVELMMHGYRGNSETDLSIGVLRAQTLGHNVLLVDHRAAGYSDGHTITFGAKESKDCLSWVDFLINKLGKDVKIFMTGISMGAATVMIAAGNDDLPKNVVGVVADCGYTSAEEIIKKVVKQMHLPVKIFYPLIKLSAKIFGRFDISDAQPIKSLKNCKLPIVFFHSKTDNFVPASMSERNYNACASNKKQLLITELGAHGMCFMFDKEGYINALKQLEKDSGITKIKEEK